MQKYHDGGYNDETKKLTWGMHNEIIEYIKNDGKEILPVNDPKFRLGYDDPRGYLPEDIIERLDEKLPNP